MYCAYLLYIPGSSLVHTLFSVRVRHVIPVYHVLHIPPLHSSTVLQYLLFVYAVVCSLAFFKIKPDDQVLAPLQICNASGCKSGLYDVFGRRMEEGVRQP